MENSDEAKLRMGNHRTHILINTDSETYINHKLKGRVNLLWTDPPFGTGKTQARTNNSYYDDSNTKYVLNILKHWVEFYMNPNGVVAVCCDYRLAYKVCWLLEQELGWFYQGEVIWTFGLGRPRTSWWAVRHNNILTFTKREDSGIFNYDNVPTTVRRSPGKGYTGPKKVGSVWDFTMNNTHPDRTGYPNQKPLEIVEPFILVHTNENDIVADPFCGSSTTGVAAIKHNRRFLGIDKNPEAIKISTRRLGNITHG